MIILTVKCRITIVSKIQAFSVSVNKLLKIVEKLSQKTLVLIHRVKCTIFKFNPINVVVPILNLDF